MSNAWKAAGVDGMGPALPLVMPRRAGGFAPPHCPNPGCRFHGDPCGWSWRRHGSFATRVSPQGIPRFRCLACGRTFSTQTFSCTYWLRRPELLVPLHDSLVACAALRQAARHLACAPSSLQRQASRLGRHAILFSELNRPAKPPDETLALDGFVTFEFSQYWPFELEFVVGVTSRFVYSFTQAELRRSGRMTARQRVRRRILEARHGRPDASSRLRAVVSALRLAARDATSLTLLSDEHAMYPVAIRALTCRVEHRTFSSRRCRSVNNPLAAVDLLDLLLRHSSANHKRETIAFAKRRQGAIERAAVFVTWRNFQKRNSEKDPRSITPAQSLGLTTRPLMTREILARRIFPSRVTLPEPLRTYYLRRVTTRQIPTASPHRLTYAA